MQSEQRTPKLVFAISILGNIMIIYILVYFVAALDSSDGSEITAIRSWLLGSGLDDLVNCNKANSSVLYTRALMDVTHFQPSLQA